MFGLESCTGMVSIPIPICPCKHPERPHHVPACTKTIPILSHTPDESTASFHVVSHSDLGSLCSPRGSRGPENCVWFFQNLGGFNPNLCDVEFHCNSQNHSNKYYGCLPTSFFLDINFEFRHCCNELLLRNTNTVVRYTK